MRVKRDLHSRGLTCGSAVSGDVREETAKYCMNTGDFGATRRRLHNFRVTRLCMSCTRLTNKNLQVHEFH